MKADIKKLLEALNRLDELASISTADNDNGEAEEQQEAYDLLSDFLTEPQSIDISFSEGDIQELQGGEVFDWTFPTNESGQDIKVNITNEDYLP